MDCTDIEESIRLGKIRYDIEKNINNMSEKQVHEKLDELVNEIMSSPISQRRKTIIMRYMGNFFDEIRQKFS